MTKRGLSLNQKLALLPATIPDCILDFLQDFNHAEPLVAAPEAIASLKSEYLAKNRDALITALKAMRDLGELQEIEALPLPKQFPGGFVTKLVFSRGVRGLGFIVLQGTARTGQIAVIVVEDDGFSADFLREKLATHYKK